MPQDSHELSNISDAAIDRLLSCVVKNDHDGIECLVKSEGVGILHADHEDYDKPILHIALDDKSNEVEAATIRCLIRLGADIYKHIINQNEAIHSAVNGQNPQLLQTIIRSIQDRDRLNATAQGCTALNFLLKEGNRESGTFMECVHILLKAGIDVNIADNKGISPILRACIKGYKDVIRAIMKCGVCVDIDTHKYGATKKTARDYMIQNHLYDDDLPPKKTSLDSNENNVTSSLWYIENGDQEGFLKLRESNVDKNDERGTLLQHACDRDQAKVVEYLVENNADVYKKTLKNERLPLEIAAYYGHDEIFKILLPKYKSIPEGIVTMLLKNMPLYEGIRTGYRKCLDMLLNSEQSLPVNERSNSQNTPLHYASLISDSSIPLKLLERGASLANRNDFDSIPIEDLDATILEQHFDNCITVQESGDRQGIIVNFNYASILPTIENKQIRPKDEEAALIEVTEPSNETDVIRVISKTAELRHLLIHPLIASFIRIKWHRMRWFFWINLSLFVLFAIFFFVYVFVPTSEYNILWWCLVVTYVMLVLRELSQFILSCRTYCCSLSNILEVGMLVACFYPICWKSMDATYKQFCSVAMVLIALELMVLGAQHPLLSTYMVMLRTVAKNFFFFLLWYAVLILAFALGFYVLFNENGDAQNSNNSKAIEDLNNDTTIRDEKCKDGKGEDDEPAFFNELGLTVIKTIVMLTGEFDASSMDFNSFWNRIIFLLFVFMISIILFNLLNGLAVSDTQLIKSEAEVVGYAERVSYIVYLENIIRGKSLPQKDDCLLRGCTSIWTLKLVPKYWVKQISLIPDYLPQKKANVKLYHDGLVIESEPKTTGCFYNLTCIARKLRCVHVDQKTVKRVKQILHERSAESDVRKQIKSLQNIIEIQNHLLEQQREEINRLIANQASEAKKHLFTTSTK